MNRLSRKEIQQFSDQQLKATPKQGEMLAQQLLDTLRENERLREELHVYRMTYNPMGKDIISGFQLRNKDSDFSKAVDEFVEQSPDIAKRIIEKATQNPSPTVCNDPVSFNPEDVHYIKITTKT